MRYVAMDKAEFQPVKKCFTGGNFGPKITKLCDGRPNFKQSLKAKLKKKQY